MNKIIGNPIAFNLDLTYQGDLIVYDGPLLSHFNNEKGEDYLYQWVDIDNNYNRWLVFKCENFYSFFTVDITLRDLILKNDSVLIIDIDDDINIVNCWEVNLNDIPTSYMPTEKSFFNNELYSDYASTLV